MTKPLVLTLGEPAGIGVDLFLQLANTLPQSIKIIADKRLLVHRAKQLNIDFQSSENQIIQIDAAEINCCGQPTIKNANYVLQTLDRAIYGCLQGEFAAMITGPVQKSILNQAGFSFSGHTEYLAEKSKIKKTVMCFENHTMRMALATTHVPLYKVPELITPELLIETIKIIRTDLQHKFNISEPKIVVCGLNPHAGEAGLLGLEEQQIIIPTLEKIKETGINVTGPFAADTIFLQKNVDCFLSLYHDQLLPAVKMHYFFETVNITLGLPFIRTSVDHGTALELAGTGKANSASLAAAIDTAQRLVTSCI